MVYCSCSPAMGLAASDSAVRHVRTTRLLALSGWRGSAQNQPDKAELLNGVIPMNEKILEVVEVAVAMTWLALPLALEIWCGWKAKREEGRRAK